MNMRACCLFLSALTLSATALAESSPPNAYLCVSDFSTGFRYDKEAKRWGPATFRPSEKYLVSQKSANDKWQVKPVGTDYPMAYCDKGFNESDILICDGVQEFRFNRKLLRFVSVYMLGYYVLPSDGQEGGDTPNLIIGTCSSL